MNKPSAPVDGDTETEKWLESLGSKFVEIWFYNHKTMTFFRERHVEDHDTLLETITMSLDRFGIKVALWDDGSGWTSIDKVTGDTRRWPTRAAAEMGAIHNV